MRPRSDVRGFSIIELLIVVLVIGALAGVAIPSRITITRRARTKALVADGRVLLPACKSDAADRSACPSCCDPPDEALDVSTLHPLTRDGHLRSAEGITGMLAGGALTSHGSPDDDGRGLDLHAVLTHRSDPRGIVLVTDTDEYPGEPGPSFDGVHVVDGGVIREADAR